MTSGDGARGERPREVAYPPFTYQSPNPRHLLPACRPFTLEGDGPEAVLLLHGFTGCPAHWRLLAPRLHRLGYTVSAPLLPGHGTRPDDLEGVSADDWVTAARQAAEALRHHRRVHLVGLSMGGLLSLIVAQPVAAASVSTINSPVLVRDPRLYLTPLLHRWVPAVSHEDQPPPPMDREARELFITYRSFPTAAAAELVRLIPRGLAAARRLRRPSLVVQSRADETVHPSSATLLHRALGPPCRLLWLQRSIHNALLGEEREVVGAAVIDRMRHC